MLMIILMKNFISPLNILIMVTYFNMLFNFLTNESHYIINMLILEMMMTLTIPIFIISINSMSFSVTSMFLFLTLVISEAILGLSILIFAYRKANKNLSYY